MDFISSNLTFTISFVAFVSIGVLIYILIGKYEQLRQLQNTVKKLRNSFHELDEQAKLIVKTDLELNKAHEELDRRFSGLDALQNGNVIRAVTRRIGVIRRRIMGVFFGLQILFFLSHKGSFPFDQFNQNNLSENGPA